MRLLMEDFHMAVSHVKAGMAVNAIGETGYRYRDCMEQDDKYERIPEHSSRF